MGVAALQKLHNTGTKINADHTAFSTTRRMENANTVDRSNSREGDQASYFYVVWPEETVTTISAAGALDPTLCGSHAQRPAATTQSGVNRHQQTLQNNDRRGQQLLQQEHRQIMEHSNSLSPPGGRLSEIEVGSFASPLTSPILSIADTSPLVTQSSAAVQTSPQGERNNCTLYANGKQQLQETNDRSNTIGICEVLQVKMCILCTYDVVL